MPEPVPGEPSTSWVQGEQEATASDGSPPHSARSIDRLELVRQVEAIARGQLSGSSYEDVRKLCDYARAALAAVPAAVPPRDEPSETFEAKRFQIWTDRLDGTLGCTYGADKHVRITVTPFAAAVPSGVESDTLCWHCGGTGDNAGGEEPCNYCDHGIIRGSVPSGVGTDEPSAHEQEIRARWAAATPGPWKLWDGWGPDSSGDMNCHRIGPARQLMGLSASGGADIRGSRENLEAMANAPADIAYLLAALAAARPTEAGEPTK